MSHSFRTRAATIAGGAVATYFTARYVEESLSFERIDACLGIHQRFEENACWVATHSLPKCPSSAAAVTPTLMSQLKRENADNIRLAVAAALSEASSDDDAAVYRVTRQLSTVGASSGDGAFVQGCCPRGAIVCFYHGPVYGPLVGRVKLMLTDPGSAYALGIPAPQLAPIARF